jgi:peptidoglycan/xylan/chitin deacetylase (PgdA/CDA1 family)
VFLVADCIGRSNAWDAAYGEQLPLMGWRQIHELQVDGIEFGSHTVNHPFLTSLAPDQQAEELIRSRAQLVRELGRCDSLAYPYGDCDEITRHLAGACGYNYAVTCEHGEASLDAGAHALPRIEVRGDETFEQFRRHLVAPLHLRGIRRAQRTRAYQWARRRVPDAAFEAGKRWYLARFG